MLTRKQLQRSADEMGFPTDSLEKVWMLAALLARGASRDLFDSRELLKSTSFDAGRLRLAFVV